MTDERPMCWMCAEGAMKDGAEIERLRAQVGEMRDALETIEGGHIDRYPGAPDFMVLPRADFRGDMWAWSQKVARAVLDKADEVLK